MVAYRFSPTQTEGVCVTKRERDIASGVFFLCFSALMFFVSNRIQINVISKYGGKIMPQAISVIMFILSALLVGGSLLQQEDPNGAKNEGDRPEDKQKDSIMSIAIVIGISVMYVALIKTVGFILMTSVVMLVMMFVLSGYRRKSIPLYAAIAVGFTLIVYFVFLRFFSLILPAGILG